MNVYFRMLFFVHYLLLGVLACSWTH